MDSGARSQFDFRCRDRSSVFIRHEALHNRLALSKRDDENGDDKNSRNCYFVSWKKSLHVSFSCPSQYELNMSSVRFPDSRCDSPSPNLLAFPRVRAVAKSRSVGIAYSCAGSGGFAPPSLSRCSTLINYRGIKCTGIIRGAPVTG